MKNRISNKKEFFVLAAVACVLFLFGGCVANNVPNTDIKNSSVSAVSSTSLAATEDKQTSEQNSIDISKSSITEGSHENQAYSKILGMALVKPQSLTVYPKPEESDEVIATLSRGIGVPFFSENGAWTYLEYGETKGWANSNDLELIFCKEELLSANQAKTIVQKELTVDVQETITFLQCYMRQELGGTLMWYVEFKLDDISGWYLVNAIDGKIFAKDKSSVK